MVQLLLLAGGCCHRSFLCLIVVVFRDGNGSRTPLHLACRNSHLDICRFLVASKANVNACIEEEGQFLINKSTPLHESVASVGVSQFLLECKAEVDAADSQ
jgi:ankyrin repeat protein